ncbi:MAG TPA: hypothetical protein VFU89_05990 [Rhabdochlamydiaceae bacterium]|nr:hypothetical protein [Rhabdochlamydiaceae bacterium]
MTNTTNTIDHKHPSSLKAESKAPNTDKMAAVGTSIGTTPTQPPKPLDGRVSYTTPWTAFINFILSILSCVFGSSKEKASEPVKTDPVVVKPALVSAVTTSQSPVPVAESKSAKIAAPASAKAKAVSAPVKTAPVKPAEKSTQAPSPVVASTTTKIPAPAPAKAEAAPTKQASPARSESPKSTSPKEKSTKEVITEEYRKGLYKKLKEQYTEEEATSIFKAIYPAFNAGLQKELEKTVDLKELKKPLRVLAQTLIQEHDAHTQLEEIGNKLMDGKLALTRKAIFEEYPTLEKSLNGSPTLKKKFETILSRVWVAKELKNLSAYQGSSFEKTVLKNLGYNISSYDDKEFLKDRLQAHFSTDELPLMEDLPKAFRKQAFDIRAMAAGAPKETLSNLRKLLTFYSGEYQKLITEAKKIKDNLKLKCSSASSTAYIKSRFHQQNLEKINDHLVKFLEKNKSEIVKNLTSTQFDDFLKSMPSLSKGLTLSKTHGESLKKAEEWFSKYQDMVITEFSQGQDDDNECLGQGVCLGLSYRMASTALESPTDAIVKVAVKSIEPSDRIIQAHHMQGVRQEGTDLLPRKLLAQRKQKEKPVFIAKGDVNVGAALVKHLQELKESNGGIMLGWGDHETFMRFDPIHKKFFFFDPNFNTIVFHKKPDETLEDLATRMAVAYIELYRWAYPDSGVMTAHQIVRLKDGEVPAEIDINKIPFYAD